jgi:hypothetical protein
MHGAISVINKKIINDSEDSRQDEQQEQGISVNEHGEGEC